MNNMGEFFVNFVGHYGYDRVLSVLGRHMRDFLNGLDNLHEYLKFSYPHIKPPSFFCENETKHGLTLHYRSRRKGFVYYTMGQIKEVSLMSFLLKFFRFRSFGGLGSLGNGKMSRNPSGAFYQGLKTPST